MATLTASFYGDFSLRGDVHQTRYPMSSGFAIYKNSFVGVSSAGYLAAPSSLSAQAVFVNDPSIPNAGYTSTAKGVAANVDANSMLCVDQGYITYTFSGLTQAHVGNTAYVLNNGTLVATSSTGKVAVGTITKYYSSTKGEVLLQRK